MRRKSSFLKLSAVMGAVVFATSTMDVFAGERDKVTPIPNSSVILLPAPEITRTSTNVPVQQITPADAPIIESVPPAADCGHPGGCANGMCEPYYRDRPKGDKDKKRHIILNNRAGEPEWYKEYRCTHFGYYPTQWAAWPEGWMACRSPQPGDHPYDRRQPSNKDAKKRFDKSGNIPNTSTGKQNPGDNLDVQPRNPRKEPELLPDLSNKKKQDDNKSMVPPPRKLDGSKK